MSRPSTEPRRSPPAPGPSPGAVLPGPDGGLRRRAARGVLWSGVETLVRQGLALATFAVLARLLTEADFGVASAAGVCLVFVQQFVSQGLGTAIVQRRDLEPGHLDSAFWLGAAVGVGLWGAIAAGAGLVADFMRAPGLEGPLRWLALTLPIAAIGEVPTALLMRELRFRAIAVRTTAASVAGGVVGIVLALRGWGVWSLVWQQLAASLAGAAALWWATAWRPGLRFSWPHLREILGFSVAVLMNNLLWFACQRADQAMIGRQLGMAPLGTYSVALNLVTRLWEALAAPLQPVAMPAFGSIQGDASRVDRAFRRATELVALAAFPAFAGIAATAGEAVPLLFGGGGKWAAAEPLVAVLAVCALVRSTTTFFHPVLLAIGRPMAHFWLLAASAAGTVVGVVVACRWGLSAVAWSLVVNAALNAALGYAMLARMVGLDIARLLGVLARLAAAAALVYAAAMGVGALAAPSMGSHGAAGAAAVLALKVAAGVLVYATAIGALCPGLAREAIGMARHALGRGRGPLGAPA